MDEEGEGGRGRERRRGRASGGDAIYAERPQGLPFAFEDGFSAANVQRISSRCGDDAFAPGRGHALREGQCGQRCGVQYHW